MYTVKGHEGKPIISTSDGRKVGEIKGFYLDPQITQVEALYLGKEGVLRRKKVAVDEEHIALWGIDAFLVSSSDIVTDPQNLPEAAEFIFAADFWGREIETDGGTKIGTVDDIMLDRDGKVLGFALGKVHVQGPIAERKGIGRSAFISFGSATEPMKISLERAEETEIPK